jgi:hypothetical protein
VSRSWDVDVSSRRDLFARCVDLRIVVKIPDEVVQSMVVRESAQHEIVEYVSRRLHEYVRTEFEHRRLPAPDREEEP